MSEAIDDRARDAQVRLVPPVQHRVAGVVHLLTAAVAEHDGAVLLHDGADVEPFARSTAQPQRWIAPRGSIDWPARRRRGVVASEVDPDDERPGLRAIVTADPFMIIRSRGP